MRAIGYQTPGSIDADAALVDIELPTPAAPQGRDILVEVKAVSVNPVVYSSVTVKPNGLPALTLGSGWGVTTSCVSRVTRPIDPAPSVNQSWPSGVVVISRGFGVETMLVGMAIGVIA